MDSKERLIAASRGGETDRIPWFAWSPGTTADQAVAFADRWTPDAVVVGSASDVANAKSSCGAPVLVEVGNPFGAAMQAGVDLTEQFEQGPEAGETAFSRFVAETERALHEALEAGADGVVYRLFGAEPTLSTPMQFGGYYLEKERELLSLIGEAPFNLLYVEGGEGVYLDVVADLRAHAFGWDEDRSAIAPADVRKMRSGALACGIGSQDPRRVLRDVGGKGLVLSGKVEDLSEQDFTDVVSAAQSLVEATR